MIGTHRSHRLPRLVKPVGQAMPSHFHQLLTPRRADSAFRMGILKRPKSSSGLHARNLIHTILLKQTSAHETSLLIKASGFPRGSVRGTLARPSGSPIRWVRRRDNLPVT